MTYPNTTLRPTSSSRFCVRQWLVLGCLAVTPLAAQTTTPNPVNPGSKPKDETVQLSPFEVRADNDTGYRSSSTLAGTRLRTDLRDVAAAVQVINKDFMQDIGANTLDDLLVYTLGTEVAGLGGNYSNHGTDANFTDFFGSVRNVQGASRIRGIAGADHTRDYFITGVPMDAYNIDRVEVNRGPNSMLFGLGSAAGIINTSLIKAQTNQTKTIVDLQYGQHETYRVALDHNQVLIKDKLALRFAGLVGEKRYQLKPANVHDERYYLTATWRPWEGATIRASTEYAKQDSNKPYNTTPTDNYTWWWDLGKPVYNPITGIGSYLGTVPTDPNLQTFNSAGAPINNLTTGGPQKMLLVQENPNSSRFGITGLPLDVMGIEGFNDRSRLTTTGAYANDGLRWTNASKNYLQQKNKASNPLLNPFWRDQKLFDPTIFNFYDEMLQGSTNYEWATWRTYNAVFEQRLGANAGIELAVDRQSLESGFVQPYQFRAHAINVDISTHLPNGMVNPNLGRPFMATADGFVNHLPSERDAFRATAYYNLDLSNVQSNWVGKLLGRHVFTGNFTNQSRSGSNYGGRIYQLGTDYIEADAVNQPSRSIVLNNGSSRFAQVQSYIGPSLLTASSPSNNGIQGLRADYLRDSELTSVVGLHYVVPAASPVALATWQKRTFSVVPTYEKDLSRTVVFPNRTGDEVDSAVFVANSYWWDNTLVSTLGWRKDSFKTYDAGVPTFDPVTGLNVIDPSIWKWTAPALDDSETSFNYGFVLHMPPSLRGKLPWGADVSLTYNKADNFRPSAQRANMFGVNIAPASGNTEEWGVLLSLFNNKLELRAVKYETIASLATADAFRELQNMIVRRLDTQIEMNSDAVYRAIAPAAALAAWEQWQQGPVAQNLMETFQFKLTPGPNGTIVVEKNERINIVVNTADQLATGYEFDIVYNPTRQWRIAFNAAKQETVSSNIGEGFAQMSALLNPIWGGTAAALPDGTNTPNTLGQAWATTKADGDKAIALDGASSTELRKWRYNIVTNYTFNEGRLKGWHIGGAYRWQDKAAIGYQIKALPSGVGAYDITNPYYGPTESNLDGWIGYNRKLAGGKVLWKVQFNVKNIGVGDELIPVSTQPDGTYDSMRIAEPQTWLLTNTFEF